MDINSIKNILKKLSIHVVPYCHTDHSWIHTREWHVKRYIQIIDEVLDLLQSNPEYTFMIDNINHMILPYLKTQRAQELIEMLNSCRLEMTGPVLSLIRPSRAGGEAFIRNIQYARECLQKLGVKTLSETYHSVDVTVGHPQLPQVLKSLGFKYYRCWRPQGAMDAKGIPRQFLWESPDGSQIMCSRGTYAGFWKTDYLDTDDFSDGDGKLEKFYSIELENITLQNSTPVTWLPFGMDDTRPLRDFEDNPINMDGFMKYLSETSDTDISFSTSEAYFNQLSNYNLQVHTGSLDPCEVAYNIPGKGDKGLWMYRTLLEKLLVRAEVLWSQYNFENYPYDKLHRLWEELLYISGHAMEFALSDDYDEISKKAEKAVKETNNLINSVFKSILTDNNDQNGLTLINPLPYQRNGVLVIPSGIIPGNDCEYQVFKSIHTGKNQIAIYIKDSFGGFGNLYFSKAADFRIKSYKITTLNEYIVNTGMITATFKDGSLHSVNKNISSNKTIGNLYFRDIIESSDDAWLHNYKQSNKYYFSAETWEITDNGPLLWRYKSSGKIKDFKVALCYTLYKGESKIDFDITIESNVTSNGFFGISFPLDKSPDMIGGIPFGHERKEIQNEIYGKATDIDIDNLERLWPGLFYFNNWLMFNSFTGPAMLVSKRLPPYAWYEDDENRLSLILTRTFNLAGCSDWMKDTHPSHECLGKFSYAFSIFFNKTGFDFTRAAVECGKIDYPLLVFNGNHLKDVKPIFYIYSSHCILSALYMENGCHIIRVYNSSCNEDNLIINSKKIIESCTLSDLCRQSVADRDLHINKRGLSILTTVRPNEIITLLIKLKRCSE